MLPDKKRAADECSQDVLIAMDDLRLAMKCLRPLIELATGKRLAQPWTSEEEHLNRARQFIESAGNSLDRAAVFDRTPRR